MTIRAWPLAPPHSLPCPGNVPMAGAVFNNAVLREKCVVNMIWTQLRSFKSLVQRSTCLEANQGKPRMSVLY